MADVREKGLAAKAARAADLLLRKNAKLARAFLGSQESDINDGIVGVATGPSTQQVHEEIENYHAADSDSDQEIFHSVTYGLSPSRQLASPTHTEIASPTHTEIASPTYTDVGTDVGSTHTLQDSDLDMYGFMDEEDFFAEKLALCANADKEAGQYLGLADISPQDAIWHNSTHRHHNAGQLSPVRGPRNENMTPADRREYFNKTRPYHVSVEEFQFLRTMMNTQGTTLAHRLSNSSLYEPYFDESNWRSDMLRGGYIYMYDAIQSNQNKQIREQEAHRLAYAKAEPAKRTSKVGKKLAQVLKAGQKSCFRPKGGKEPTRANQNVDKELQVSHFASKNPFGARLHEEEPENADVIRFNAKHKSVPIQTMAQIQHNLDNQSVINTERRYRANQAYLAQFGYADAGYDGVELELVPNPQAHAVIDIGTLPAISSEPISAPPLIRSEDARIRKQEADKAENYAKSMAAMMDAFDNNDSL